MIRAVSLAGTLALFWLLLSGLFTVFLLSLGAASVAGVVLLARRMDVIDHEGHPVHLGRGALWYWPWLAKEVARSGWQVTRIILDPKLPIEPTLVRVRPGQRTPAGLAVHANSITLTPGTVSIDVGEREFLVHALTREGAEGVLSGEMDAVVSRFEGSR
jgi:multicomponent Na+:H+ antiporter subunit E